MVEFLKFSHNRNESFKKSCDNMRDTIDSFVDDTIPKEWYDYFSMHYQLPEDVVKKQTKMHIERLYDYVNCTFSKNLHLKNRFQMAMKHSLFLFYALLKSRKYDSQSTKHYNLIIEWVASDRELSRFSKLIETFGKEKVLITSTVLLASKGFNISFRPTRKFYDRIRTLKTFWIELIHGLRLYLRVSTKIKVNMLPVVSHIINQYLYYSSIFKYSRSKYCIQERHYQTSAIKNYLFHKYGGVYSACLQKNIHQLGSTGFYYDADMFFALGKRTAERAFEYGARIDHLIPVGSLFMEHYYFNSKVNDKSSDNRYDIVSLGINYGLNYEKTSMVNSYSTFTEDYYETFWWLSRFSKENPSLRIGIKHHMDNLADKLEADIIKNTSIERIDHRLNSYKVASEAKCAVTFCSTMGYELIAHGFPVFFLDPGRRDIEILPEDNLIDEWRVTTYEEFRNALNNVLVGKKLVSESTSLDDLCLRSDNVAENIYNILTGKEKTRYEYQRA